MKKNFFWWKK